MEINPRLSGTFTAYDSLYAARYRRLGDNRISLMLEYAPADGDMRPDNLAADTTVRNLFFSGRMD